MTNGNGTAILFAIIAVIITVLLRIFFPNDLMLIIVTSLGAFAVVFIIATYILDTKKVREKIMELINKPIKTKWVLVVIIFMVITSVTAIVASKYDRAEGIEGKVKCVLPDDDSVKIFDLHEIKSPELECIFPQVAVPFSGTYTYATSGKINSKFNKDTLDGRECYTKITFQNFCDSYDCNSGWMISPLWGYNASEFTYLSFWVKGAKGEEKFGVKIKETRGAEVKVEVMEYIADKKIGTRWQKVIIPLEHFLNVDMSTIDIISLYSDGKLSYKDSETIYVTDFKLYN